MKVKDLLKKLNGVDPDMDLFCYLEERIFKVVNLDSVGVKNITRNGSEWAEVDGFEDPDNLEIINAFVI